MQKLCNRLNIITNSKAVNTFASLEFYWQIQQMRINDYIYNGLLTGQQRFDLG